MKNKKVISGALLVVILVAIVGGIWWRNNQSSEVQQSSTTIRVGSKDFTENLVIAEIYALALEDNGYTVERVSNISSSLIHNSIVNDEIDLYPEYTGTGLLSVLGEDMETDSEKVYKTVKKEYEEQFNLTWLDYASANDSQGLVIRTEVANSLNIKTISDLQAHASELRFASQGEFDEREDGLPGLEKTYGTFNWQSSKVYDNSLKYSVLENDEADVTPAYTTEGQLVSTDKFTLLEDDKRLTKSNQTIVKLPYSKEKFSLPPNLYIVGTMNTSDKSIALLDIALRRRFNFEEIMPDYDLLSIVDGIDIRKMLYTINKRIEFLYDRDHVIGQAYLLAVENINDIVVVFRSKIIPLLQEYFYYDSEKVGLILGGIGRNEKDKYIVYKEKLIASELFKNNNASIMESKVNYCIKQNISSEELKNIYE